MKSATAFAPTRTTSSIPKNGATSSRCPISPGDEALSIARARVEPGVTTALHKVIDTAERYVVLAGEGIVDVEGLEPTGVQAGDVVLIAPGAGQRITNTGVR